MRIFHSSAAICWIAMLPLLLIAGPAPGQTTGEELNCLICHKHRGLSRIDEEGNFRLFYIDQELFESGPHRRNKCADCHTDIDRIPHNPAKKVDCTQECHVTEPSGQRPFSHQPIAEILSGSVHSRFDAEGNEKPYPEDYPDCKDCHEEPIYRPFSVYKGSKMPGVSQRGITRCKACHRTGNFAEDFYEHVTSRLHKTRFPLETIKICAKCHQDEELLARHDLHDAVKTYRDTFHGKLMILGSETTPDCIDCHVVVGENTHMIESQETLTSSVHANNVSRTCRSSECHEKADPQLADFHVHMTYEVDKYPMEFYMIIFFKGLMAVVLYFFLTLIFFELMRRLFPRFALNPDPEMEPGGGGDVSSGTTIEGER